MILRVALLAITAVLCAGCKEEKIRVYLAPTEHLLDEAASGERPQPQVTWTLPNGWRQTEAGQVSLANFAIQTAAGEASVNITPLPNLRGREAMVVNMWREQVGQPPLTEDEITAALTPVEVGGAPGQLFEIGAEGKHRIITAIQHREETSWFFKLAGDEAVVAAEKPTFLEFLKSIHINETSAATPDAGATGRFKWAVPDQWRAVPPGQMQVAKFNVPAQDGAKADVTVSIFPSDTGGTLANVNRWRKQVGLAEIGESDLAPLITPLEPGSAAVLVDLVNDKKRLLGAIVPRGNEWFFYKLLGDAAAVTAARDSFIEFVKSQP